MKRTRSLYALLAVLAVAGIATFSVLQLQERTERIKNSDEVVLEVPPESVQSLSWEYESETLAFHKDDVWRYDSDQSFPVDQDKIAERLAQFAEFGVSFVIEEVEDYAQYGLDDPTATITFATADRSYDVLLGDFSTMDSQRYVSIGDGNVYLVKNDPLEYFDAVLSDMIDHDETPAFDDVSEIRFSGSAAYTITHDEDSDRAYSTEDVYFVQPDGAASPLELGQSDAELPLDTSRVDAYLAGITALGLTDYVTYDVSDEELRSYGLDSPELTVTVDYSDENGDGTQVAGTFVLNISRDPREKASAEATPETTPEATPAAGEDTETEEQITAYVRVGSSQIVYRITGDEYKALMAASYNSLRHLEVLPVSIAEVEQVDVSLDGSEYTFTSEKKGDDRVYSYQDEELEFSDFQNALQALSADRFTDEQPTQQAEIVLTVHLDNENYPEMKIALYRYDGADCLAVVDGTPVSLVDRSLVVDLVEAVHAIVLTR